MCMYVCVCTCTCTCMCEHVHVNMYVECVFSEIVCSALCFSIDFVCVHLLLDQLF